MIKISEFRQVKHDGYVSDKIDESLQRAIEDYQCEIVYDYGIINGMALKKPEDKGEVRDVDNIVERQPRWPMAIMKWSTAPSLNLFIVIVQVIVSLHQRYDMSNDIAIIVDGSKGEDIICCILSQHIFWLWRIHWISICTPLSECCLVFYP